MTGEEPVAEPIETLEIQNVVASTGIGQELDLQAVASDLGGVDYNPEQFPGIVYRPANHARATALIFRSGKIVCTGATSVEGIHEAVDATFDALRDIGVPVEESPEITVQNIVTSGDFGQVLNLASCPLYQSRYEQVRRNRPDVRQNLSVACARGTPPKRICRATDLSLVIPGQLCP
jgi:TATA-box binding protein (TBP) (component of TFIID and TFIIIB)